MKKINVLFVFAEPFSYGGQEAFAINMYKKIDKNKISIDFYTPFKCDNSEIENLLKQDGNQIYYDNYEFYSRMRKKNYIMGLRKMLSKMKYDIIHINSGSTFALAKGSKIVKELTNSKVIVHSHATGINNLKHTIAQVLFLRDYKYVDCFLACSKIAGVFRFSKKIVESDKFNVINNGIDVEKYKFNPNIRKKIRKKLNIKDEDFVLGNVGRLSAEKNHSFIIDIFCEISKLHKNVKLLLVGDGPLQENITERIKKEKIEDSVILLQRRDDINFLLNSMDIFLFPSVFEGLGIAAVEAQFSGLTTLCSTGVPEDAKITDRCIFLDLNNKNDWIDTINAVMKKQKSRDYAELNILNSKFDSIECAKELEKKYMEVINDN